MRARLMAQNATLTMTDNDIDSGKQREYTHYNYVAYNNAVDLVAMQHDAIARNLKETVRIKRMQFILLVLAAISVVLLVAAIIYWLLMDRAKVAVASDSAFQTQQQLESIADSNSSSVDVISESFVQYTSLPTQAGEVVVTGKQYQPSDLKKPNLQFCYLTQSLTIIGAQEVELASMENDEIVVKVQDEYLITEALPLCSFTTEDL